ncbi:General stress protein CTC [subsurface metagenome]
MGDLTLKVTNRDVLGKKTRFLRRQGISPVHLFGHSVKSLALQCDTAQLQHIIAQAGTTKLINLEIDEEKHPRSVFIREIQRNAGNRDLLHVDFYQIRKKERIKVEVPIVLVGEAPALKSKGSSLMQTLDTLSIESLPDKLPPQIEVDLSSLEEVGQTIHVRDIPLSPDITLNTDPDQLVVKVSEARVEVVEEVVEEVEAEAEVKAEAEPEQEPAD